MIPKKIKDKLWSLTEKMYGSKIEHTSFTPDKDIAEDKTGLYYLVWFNDPVTKSTHTSKILKKDVE